MKAQEFLENVSAKGQSKGKGMICIIAIHIIHIIGLMEGPREEVRNKWCE